MINLEDMEKTELKQLHKDVEKAIEMAERNEVFATIAKMDEVAIANGFRNAEHVFNIKSNMKKKLGTVPPKFRNPDNPSETWTGRGRRPRWFNAALEKGHTEDSMRIK